MVSFVAWLLESSLLVLMVFGIRKAFMGRVPYAGIYALWLVVLLRFMVPVNVISTPFSVANFLAGAFSAEDAVEVSGQDVFGQEMAAGEIKQPGKDVVVPADDTVGGTAAAGRQTDAVGRETSLVRQEAGSVQGTWDERPAGTEGGDWTPLLKKVWLAVSVLFFLWIFMSNVRLLGRLKRNRVLYGRRERIKIYMVGDIRNPCLYGFLRPAIYLPESLVADGKMDADELDQVITHEFVHYLHGDHVWAMLRVLLVSVYWFDPCVWWAVSVSKKDAELFCDETTIRLLGEEKRFRYGAMLVRLAGDHTWMDFRFSMMSMSRRGREMEKRIRAIGTKKRYSKIILIPLAAVLLVAAGVTCSTGIAPLAGPGRTAGSAGGDGAASGTAADGGEPVPESGQAVGEQLSIYADFLKDHAGEEGYRYYSLAWLAEDHVVLLVSTATNAEEEASNWIDDGRWGSTGANVYNVVGGSAVPCGKVACSSSGEWAHLSDGKILTDTHHAVMKAWVEPETDGLVTVATTDRPVADAGDVSVEQSVSSMGDSSEYAAWQQEFEQSASILFHTSPYVGKKTTADEPKVLALLDNEAYYAAHDSDGYGDSPAYAATAEEAFENYMEIFTGAVNSGDIGKLHQVLDADSDVYQQQCELVKNYYRRGIREEIQTYSIVSANVKDAAGVEIDSGEAIKVFYADSTSKTVRQSYRYTCEYIGQSWVITNMEAIS